MDDIFTKSFPSIDLHGYDANSAKVATNDFINDSLILKNSQVLIVHGKGMGIVKKAVHEALHLRKEVIKYHTMNSNDGCTIAYLNIDKE